MDTYRNIVRTRPSLRSSPRARGRDTFANATAKAGISLTIPERFSLGLKGVGTLIKMMYAFLWQEEIIPWFGIKDASLNRFGGEAMPYVNALGNALSGFAHYDDNVQKAQNVYPGDTQCRVACSYLL